MLTLDDYLLSCGGGGGRVGGGSNGGSNSGSSSGYGSCDCCLL